MARTTYPPEFKAKLVMRVIEGREELTAVALENSINPNMLRNWRSQFIANAGKVFEGMRKDKETSKKEVALKKEREQMLKTIDQLTRERDFLQACFR